MNPNIGTQRRSRRASCTCACWRRPTCPTWTPSPRPTGTLINPNDATTQVPAGILYLRVLEAANLPNMDIFTKTDAYAVVFVRGRRKRKTHVVNNSLNPK